MLKKIKLSLVTSLIGLLLLFIVQNWAVVPLQFLFWSFDVPRLLLVVFLLLAGFFLGVIYATFSRD